MVKLRYGSALQGVIIPGLFFGLLAFLTGCEVSKTRTYAGEESAYKIIGYVGPGTDVSDSDAHILTHINYAFARLNPDGSLYLSHEDGALHLSSLNGLKEKHPHLKILISIGGWGADHFSDAALTDSSRTQFAREILEFIETHELDGVDLDWEYPGQPGPGIKYRAEDKENFTLMLKAVREQLDTARTGRTLRKKGKYLLTIAANDDEGYFKHTQMDTLHHYLDFINVMTYDYYTLGSRTTGHHTGLFRSEADTHSTRFSHAGIDRFIDAGVPLDKIIMGAAFYGRGWRGVSSIQNGKYQPYDSFYGAYGYRHLVERYIDKNGFERFWDDAAQAPYLWNADSSIFISYDDPESLSHKASFVRENQLGGMMYWQHRHDWNGEMVRALAEGLR